MRSTYGPVFWAIILRRCRGMNASRSSAAIGKQLLGSRDVVLYHKYIGVALVAQLVVLFEGGSQFHVGMSLPPHVVHMLIAVEDRIQRRVDIHAHVIVLHVRAAGKHQR